MACTYQVADEPMAHALMRRANLGRLAEKNSDSCERRKEPCCVALSEPHVHQRRITLTG